MSKVSQQDIEALVELFDRSDWRVLHVEGDGVDLFVSKDPAARRPAGGAVQGVRETLTSTPAASPKPTPGNESRQNTPETVEPRAQYPSHWKTVKAPSIGTFYRAPKPGADPFVSTGQAVEAQSELCIIEVMKLFTTVNAGISGTVRAILAEDGKLVEFDEPLFVIEPGASR